MRQRNIIDLEPHGVPFAACLARSMSKNTTTVTPMISAVVVSRETRQPGVGFWNIANDLDLSPGQTEDERERFWLASLKECHERWKP